MRGQPITDWQQTPIILDLPYTARLLGLSVDTLKKQAQRGELPGAFKCGNCWRVSREILRKRIEQGA